MWPLAAVGGNLRLVTGARAIAVGIRAGQGQRARLASTRCRGGQWHVVWSAPGLACSRRGGAGEGAVAQRCRSGPTRCC